MTYDEFIKEVNDILSVVYEPALLTCMKKYNSPDDIFGEPFEDIFHEGITRLLTHLKKLYADGDDRLEGRLTRSYFQNAITNNFSETIYIIANKMRLDVKTRTSNIVNLEDDEEVQIDDGFERIEVEDFLGKTRGRTKAFIMSHIRGDETTDSVNRSKLARDKLGVRSVRQYYRTLDNVRSYLVRNGYEGEVGK